MPSTLFSPGKIGTLDLPNRLIRSATQDPFALPDGSACQPQVDLYSAIAATGAGLIINGYAYVSQDGRSSLDQIGPVGRDVTDWIRSAFALRNTMPAKKRCWMPSTKRAASLFCKSTTPA